MRRWRGELVAQGANLRKERTGGVMFAGHHGDGIGHAAKAGFRQGTA